MNGNLKNMDRNATVLLYATPERQFKPESVFLDILFQLEDAVFCCFFFLN